MSDHFRTIYLQHAEDYHRLVEAEDCDRVLLPALAGWLESDRKRVVEVGVGTARIARQLLGMGAEVVGIDLHRPMLEVARRILGTVSEGETAGGWSLLQGDLVALPVRGGWADLTVAGWTLGHQRGWEPERWREILAEALAEMDRVTRPGGVVAVLETQGTGSEQPAPPPGLDEVGEFFEAQGFQGRTLRTDYAFPSPEEAAETCRFFFGDALADRILAERWHRVPECTGLWWRRTG